jgi:hypothetical protein
MPPALEAVVLDNSCGLNPNFNSGMIRSEAPVRMFDCARIISRIWACDSLTPPGSKRNRERRSF